MSTVKKHCAKVKIKACKNLVEHHYFVPSLNLPRLYYHIFRLSSTFLKKSRILFSVFTAFLTVIVYLMCLLRVFKKLFHKGNEFFAVGVAMSVVSCKVFFTVNSY